MHNFILRPRARPATIQWTNFFLEEFHPVAPVLLIAMESGRSTLGIWARRWTRAAHPRTGVNSLILQTNGAVMSHRGFHAGAGRRRNDIGGWTLIIGVSSKRILPS